LVLSYETGLYARAHGESNYRVPDLLLRRPEDRSERGVEGRAELVIEILSVTLRRTDAGLTISTPAGDRLIARG
jgi:predicted membrane GTPase involved in stress response